MFGGAAMSNPLVLQVLNPRGEPAYPERMGLFAPRPSDLNGKRVAILAMYDCMDFFKAIAEMLGEKYPKADIRFYPSMSGPNSPDDSADIAANCDVWVEGIKVATTGGRFDNGVRLEKRGCPGVSICTDALLPHKKLMFNFNGMPTCRVVPISSTEYCAAKGRFEQMKKVAVSAFPAIDKAMTSPLTREETDVEDLKFDNSPLSFEGADYADALEKFQQYCAENHMTDGMPVLPPTKEAVARMLEGTSLPPETEIGLMYPIQGRATVEKIAINAVMAGAKPEYLPIIITMIETIAKDFNQYHIVNEILPVTLLSGPIIEELKINNKNGYLAPGHRANATIGRALLMCMINIGWRRMDVYSSPGGAGQPAAYANYLIAENQSESPWETYAESTGFAPGDSTVTICETLSLKNGPAEIFSVAGYEQRLEELRRIFASYGGPISLGIPPASMEWNMKSIAQDYRHMLVMHPTLAWQLHNAGFTRRSFIQWLYDNTVIDWDSMTAEQQAKTREAVAAGKFPGVTTESLKPGFFKGPFTDVRHVALIVSGTGAGGTKLFSTMCGSTGHVEDVVTPRPFMHKKIHGATKTVAGK
jgi:hypothetical protein